MVPKGLLTFPGFFYAMQSLVPVGHFRNISRHLFTWLVCGCFQWRHGLLFTNCIMWGDKDRVVGFERSHLIFLGWWSSGSPKLQLFQFLQHSHVTNCQLISSSATFHEIWHYYGSGDKMLQSKSRTQCRKLKEEFFVSCGIVLVSESADFSFLVFVLLFSCCCFCFHFVSIFYFVSDSVQWWCISWWP